ncbi:hypothetical protein GCM10007036_14760 [Alsobacter metallidurans]|uniref:Uncharacterized protein n=2 Tax=Alsobacter metallidurans TaxID=340221 RepID=A0A917MH68_9HYPH|nr:hypothetical protein GCM10007036_14760 [Alsobacter metallidurans]
MQHAVDSGDGWHFAFATGLLALGGGLVLHLVGGSTSGHPTQVFDPSPTASQAAREDVLGAFIMKKSPPEDYRLRNRLTLAALTVVITAIFGLSVIHAVRETATAPELSAETKSP